VGPEIAFHTLYQRLAFIGEADGARAAIFLRCVGSGQAEPGEAVVDAGDAGLAHADNVDRLTNGERAVAVQRREEREMAGLHGIAHVEMRARRIRLHAFGEALQPAAEGEIASL
jgi:hypothetical protein